MSEYTHLGLSIALGRPEDCHEEVARGDELEPCDKTAVALRVDPQEGEPYPVCAHHARLHRDAELLQSANRRGNHRKITVTAHDYCNFFAH